RHASARAPLRPLKRPPAPPPHPPPLATARWLDLMAGDKKVRDGQWRLILLEAIGRATVTPLKEQLPLRETLLAFGALPDP
ncbi:MAG: 3-dehydroquinate synthase, partial [Candidatus Competibacterales bacterium]